MKKLLNQKMKSETAKKKKEMTQLEIHIEPLEHRPPPTMGARRVRNGDEQDARGGRKKRKGVG